MKDLTILRNDLRSYFLNVKDYLKSGGDATICAAKENCRFACFGSLPWGISSTKFSQVLDWVPGSWNIESQIDYCVEWVENELRKKSRLNFVS
jgi:hypothetical protein